VDKLASVSSNAYSITNVTEGHTVAGTFALDGVCGASNGALFTIAPASNLCSFGTPSAVSGSGPWSWTCAGDNGGTAASCSANLQGTVVIPKTGQTGCWGLNGAVVTCAGTGQDGDKLAGAVQDDPVFTDNGDGTITDKVYAMTWQKDAGNNGASVKTGIVGVPATRFTDNGNGTQTDNLTGLVWLKDLSSSCFSSAQTWSTALNSSNTLASGSCGLTDASVAGDWRLPNIDELASVATNWNVAGAAPAAWLNDAAQGFNAVQAGFYWSSSSYAGYTGSAWYVLMDDGYVGHGPKFNYYYVWPVRGGQSGSFGSLSLSKTGTGTGNVVSVPAGISCGATCSASFAAGTSVVLTATADSGSSFTSWTGCDSTNTNQCTVTATGIKSISATFTLIPPTTHTVSFTSNGGSAVSSQTVAENTTATSPTAPTRSGYTFSGWYADSSLTAAFAFTTAITADTTLYAKWTVIPPTIYRNPNSRNRQQRFT
jgi:uncharacterized repeat protein (TIGR02543 family)